MPDPHRPSIFFPTPPINFHPSTTPPLAPAGKAGVLLPYVYPTLPRPAACLNPFLNPPTLFPSQRSAPAPGIDAGVLPRLRLPGIFSLPSVALPPPLFSAKSASKNLFLFSLLFQRPLRPQRQKNSPLQSVPPCTPQQCNALRSRRTSILQFGITYVGATTTPSLAIHPRPSHHNRTPGPRWKSGGLLILRPHGPSSLRSVTQPHNPRQ